MMKGKRAMKFQVRILQLLLLAMLFSILGLIRPTTRQAEARYLERAGFLETANPNANDNTKKVLNYLAALPERQESRIVSGQHIGNKTYQLQERYTHYIEDLQLQIIIKYQILRLEIGYG